MTRTAFYRAPAHTAALTALLLVVLWPAGPAAAQDATLFNGGSFSFRGVDGGILEPPVPIFLNGLPVAGGSHKAVEIFDQVPGTGSFPLTLVDLHANSFIRATYQRANGSTASLGTSFVGAMSFRTAAGLQFIPTIARGDIDTTSPVRYRSTLTGAYGSQANFQSIRTYNDPPLGRTQATVQISFEAQQTLALNTNPFFRQSDRFRVATVSSMFSSETVFDASAIRYEAADGSIQTIVLTDDTARNRHLLSKAQEVGGWLELIKTPGSTWFPDSPSIRIDIQNPGGLRLGVQGFLAGTTNPNDDSLSVWLEWLDAPDLIPAGTELEVVLRTTARAPRELAMAGDVNGDGFVGAADLDVLLGLWNQTVAQGSPGDFTGDGFVGAGDLDVLLGAWNQGVSPGTAAATAIPEPATAAALALLAGLGLTRRRSARRY